jgi:hypothetical protein
LGWVAAYMAHLFSFTLCCRDNMKHILIETAGAMVLGVLLVSFIVIMFSL